MVDRANSLAMPENRVVQVEDLTVRFVGAERTVEAVRNLSFHVDRGETLAIVGESGSGKSVTSLALMRLVEHGGGRIAQGRIALRRRNGDIVDLGASSQRAMRSVRGADMAMIFQEPMTSLNPVFTAGEQIAETIRLHQGKDAAAARAEALRMLEQVRIPEARSVMDRHPHQLSGGMRQRVMIAMALACKPALLIADEPTTALDVTIQAQILQLIRQLQEEMRMGVVFITHDMGVVAEVADRVLVMYRGDKVEEGPSERIFAQPRHRYTQALLSAVPKLGAMQGTDHPARFPLLRVDESAAAEPGPPATPAGPAPAESGPAGERQPILSVRDLITRFDLRGGIFSRVQRRVHAVEKVSFDLYPGETLSLVGESGCGKSTTGRSLLRLVDSQGGQVHFGGRDITKLKTAELQALRRDIQFVFQDPFASLDPRVTVGFSIMEPLLVHGVASGKQAERRVAELLERVGMPPEMAQRYPHEFSGGQRQRICIARALALDPKVVIADESVSALDVSIQAQIVNLLIDLQRDLGIAFLFISHDMAVVERVSHRVAVMYLGQIVEIGPRRAIFENPQHPYTRKLMAAVPIADPARRHMSRTLLSDEIPSPIRQLNDEPVVAPLVAVGPDHFVARHSVGGAY
ncbi:dipeptide ABC transporter ATP-binding protein [Bordetella bronchiseptica]|uniref:Glutathione import ATP-binding protein GsiA n=2 Tax=Bordetella bronchiseptica TaxID=518 RepID=A0A0H3LYY0_BORBR|nr:dipeptide ABC transporter ATP-binding protein [Bordetella bronchiseptica]KAK64322.1 glutathione ABC transporter, ATP-binding protein GsiA [Bordetella bronchiseptica 980-2]AMG89781.1 ABC transporter ATP-binding protein [Bordetella bronchiseptica]KCV52254.1 glutathione ABC transporter, ATP-binding protein GsiA [Bordetella bronchiseptica 3E44]KCV55743.1 glutathione ABC transporter, ATP-binding protein GsiA [Bordetella bronchiseptica 980]KDB82627.1 glutathione ABC transporter, ATP-binding prote